MIPERLSNVISRTKTSGDENGPHQEEPGADTVSADLQELRGIGPAFEDRLTDAGIYTIKDLADSNADDVAKQTSIKHGRLNKLIDRATETIDNKNEGTSTDGDRTEAVVEDGMDSIFDPVGELHKGFVAPNNIREGKTHVETDYDYVRCFYVKAWPRHVYELFLSTAINSPNIDFDISFHMEPRDDETAKDQLTEKYNNLQRQKREEEEKGKLAVQDTKEALKGVAMLREYVTQKHRKVYDVATYITIRADVRAARDVDDDPGLKQLRENARFLISILERYGQTTAQLSKYQQTRSMKSTAPIGYDELGKQHAMLGNAAAAMFPFTSNQVLEPGGVKLGMNVTDDSPVIINPFARENGYNQLRVGTIGSGKSFAAKQFLLRQAMSDADVEIIVVDPMGGFLGVNEALGGDWIQVEGKETINPLEIEETPQHVLETSDVDPWGNKLADVRWFLDQFFGIRGDTLTNEEKAVLMRAVKHAYNANGITTDPTTHSNESPTLKDVIQWLTAIQEDPEEHTPASTGSAIEDWVETASKLQMGLEPFREDGEYANLSGETDLEFGNSRMTYIDISQVSARADTQSLMMQILFSMLYQRTKQSDRKTIMMIDEAHKIFKNSENLTFFEEVFRHSRHFDLSIQLISQTLEEFYQNETTRAIANQCVVKYIHPLKGINREVAEEVLRFNDQHIEFIEQAERGEGDKNYTEALIQIDDIGSVPLRIRATRDEAAVIDYDPTESWDDLTEPASNRIRRALDRSLRTRHDIEVNEDLADRVEEQFTTGEDADREGAVPSDD
jgi:hypothetical protein